MKRQGKGCTMVRQATARRVLVVSAAAVGLAAVMTGSDPARAASKDWNTATGNWSTSGNWTPNGMPGGQDIVSIGNTAAAANATVTLNLNTTIAQLALTDGMTLNTNGFNMTVGTSTSVSGFNSTGTGDFATTLRVVNGVGSFNFHTDNLFVSNGAHVDLVGGGQLQVDGSFSLDGTSQLAGNGVVNFTGSDASVFTVDGTIVPGLLGMTLNQLGTGRIDLDGGIAGDRTIAVTTANVNGTAFSSFTVNGDQLLDAFDDTIEIGSSNVVNMNLSNGWTLGSVGKLRFTKNPSFGLAAQLNGGTVTINGDIEFNGAAHGQINSAAVINSTMSMSMPTNSLMDFNGDTTINGGVFTLAKSARMSFDGPTHVNGGTFTTFNSNAIDGDVTFNGATSYSGTVTFNGVARQLGNVGVGSDGAVINAGLFDMGGSFPTNAYTLAGSLVINANAIDAGGDNDFDGTINIVGNGFFGAGALTVNLPAGQSWRINNALNMQGPAFGQFGSAINGSPVTLAGTTTVNAANAITARTTFASTSTTTINNGSYLRLDGGTLADPNTISGGLITGTGTLHADGAHALVGSGTINTTVNFINGAELRARGGTLTVNGTAIKHVGVLGTADATGTLNLASSFDTTNATKLELLGGTVTGAAIANGGLTSGFGTISTQSFTNNNTLTAAGGGELVLNTVDAPDLDGVMGGVPVVNVVAGNLRVIKAPADSFDGIANVGGGRTMRLDNGWTLDSGGTLSLGGSLVQPSTVSGGNIQVLFGRTNVSFGGQFDIVTGFLGGSSVSLPNASDQLSLLKDSAVNSGATFTGNGSLRNAAGAKLALNNGANVNVHIQNDGTLVVAAGSVGTATVKSLTNMPNASVAVDIGGPMVGVQFDHLTVSEGATLGGNLSLTRLNGYDPTYLAKHEIITAGANGISGKFKTILGTQITPMKWWAVTYDADSVFVTAALPGDANLNGVVNFDDYVFTDLGFNNGLAGWGNGDFNGDGVVNFDDYVLIDLGFNNQNGSLAAVMNWFSGQDRSLQNASLPGVQQAISHFEQFGADYARGFAAAVPEPGTIVLVGVLGLGAGLRRRRRGASYHR
jgi:hypothetical protein